jgi:hypothetical protein
MNDRQIEKKLEFLHGFYNPINIEHKADANKIGKAQEIKWIEYGKKQRGIEIETIRAIPIFYGMVINQKINVKIEAKILRSRNIDAKIPPYERKTSKQDL